jgi:cysteine desulfurase/selenocysteine lyase
MNDLSLIRQEFPAISQLVNGQPLVYLDSAATSLKPKRVIEALDHFHRFEAANVHRGAHYLSSRATEKFERSREVARRFLKARDVREIVMTAGTTDAINLIAQAYGRQKLKAGDEILITEMEHHSNIVPWQMLEREMGVKVVWAPVTDQGEIDREGFKRGLTARTKIVSITHASNVLGTVNPVKELIQWSHDAGAIAVVDAAQSATFMPLDVQDLNCDFLMFSGHKVYGPYGVGVLYGKGERLLEMEPARGGGASISRVSKAGTTFLSYPQKFESGTPNIAGVIGLGVALEFLLDCDRQTITEHEKHLVNETVERLADIPGVKFLGQSPSRVNVVSFNIEGVHPSDIAHILDQQGVAVRSGHHCAQPLMERFGLTGSLRVSFGVYNNHEDLDVFFKALLKAKEMLK